MQMYQQPGSMVRQGHSGRVLGKTPEQIWLLEMPHHTRLSISMELLYGGADSGDAVL